MDVRTTTQHVEEIGARECRSLLEQCEIVDGNAPDITTALNEQFAQMRVAPTASFAALDDPHWLAIAIERISGRRLTR